MLINIIFLGPCILFIKLFLQVYILGTPLLLTSRKSCDGSKINIYTVFLLPSPHYSVAKGSNQQCFISRNNKTRKKYYNRVNFEILRKKLKISRLKEHMM
jgi:hypothetical protein